MADQLTEMLLDAEGRKVLAKELDRIIAEEESQWLPPWWGQM
jgi:hypothetical protein